MHHPYENDTRILIDIQADNRAEILQCVQESFEYMPGWTFGDAASNAKVNHPEARIFVFNLTVCTFDWWRTNDSLSDTMDGDEVIVKDLADISNLLEFVYQNCESLRPEPDLAEAFKKFFAMGDPAPPPKKRKESESQTKINVSKLEAKLKEYEKAGNGPVFNPMMFIEEMPQPKAKVYYKDFVEAGGKALQFKTTVKVKLGKIPKSSWGAEEEKAYQVSQQQLHEKMAADVAAEIDKEVLADILKSYEKYAKEAHAKKTQTWYSEASKQQAWGHGWKYSPNPAYEGIMIKAPPYHMVDSMDY